MATRDWICSNCGLWHSEHKKNTRKRRANKKRVKRRTQSVKKG